MQIFSWNVNGIRAGLKKGTFLPFIEQYQPDILCLQETKAKVDQVEIDLPAYQEYWNSAERPGYSGTAIFSKIPTLNHTCGFNEHCQQHPWQDDHYGNPLSEGRLQTAEYEKFFLINVYVPNSKPDLSRLNLRHEIWDPALLEYIKCLEQEKPVIICGDFNAAHQPIDLARPKQNTHNAGFTAEEREGISNFLASGLIDTFRQLHPNAQRYTWWSHFAHARENNIGWRIDYFFISPQLLPHLKSAEIYEQVLGSDHCPISIELEI